MNKNGIAMVLAVLLTSTVAFGNSVEVGVATSSDDLRKILLEIRDAADKALKLDSTATNAQKTIPGKSKLIEIVKVGFSVVDEVDKSLKKDVIAEVLADIIKFVYPYIDNAELDRVNSYVQIVADNIPAKYRMDITWFLQLKSLQNSNAPLNKKLADWMAVNKYSSDDTIYSIYNHFGLPLLNALSDRRDLKLQ